MNPEKLALYFQYKLEAEWGPEDLRRQLNAGNHNILLLDVREKRDYQTEHIPGSINIPVSEMGERWEELPKDKCILCYSHNITCKLSEWVACKLAQRGYDVKELVGGIHEWKRAGFVIESVEELPPPLIYPNPKERGTHSSQEKFPAQWPPRDHDLKPLPQTTKNVGSVSQSSEKKDSDKIEWDYAWWMNSRK